jgi:A/G-specific adenine glycosylase
MLQQTRVSQGMPYYFSFINAFPTIFELANASEEEVLKLWQGLGYYSRARNLHRTAQYIAFELNGKFPDNYKDLLLLKGVGDYTAAAIASFSYNEAVPVVDGNVFRVLSRYFDIQSDIARASSKKEFAATAFELMQKKHPGLFNQAIMEFGALQCVPRNPDCGKCVLNSGCIALQKKKVNQLPVKSSKLVIKNRFFNYLVFLDDDKRTIIHKRLAKDIWQNLYEFPLIETDKEEDFDLILSRIQKSQFLSNRIVSLSLMNPESKIHKLTHQRLHIKFWQVKMAGEIEKGINYKSLITFPFPVAIFDFIEKKMK